MYTNSFKWRPVLLTVIFWVFGGRGGEGGEWLPCRHVIAVWKICFTLFISSLAKLGVFYALTHFGMEKHEKKEEEKKKSWRGCLWHGIYPQRLSEGEEREKEMPHLPCEECNRMSTPFKSFLLWIRKVQSTAVSWWPLKTETSPCRND